MGRGGLGGAGEGVGRRWRACAGRAGSVRARSMIPRAELEELLAAEGISVKDNVLLRAELEECARASAALGAPVEEVRIPYDSNPQSVLCRALTGQLAVPNWARFTADLTEIFESVAAEVHGGRCADYIPILAASDPRKFAVSVTTVDGQRMHLGDASADVTLQSCMKPFLYSIAAEDAGLESVHRFVGYEPSGMTFNEVTLNDEGLPHNPMINAGAIATCAVLCRGRGPAERFQFFTDRARALAGGGDVGFSQATYLSEMETTYRNTALVHVMTEYGALPRRVNPRDALDLYIQLCSVECSTSTVATMAATLANGGLCPLTGVKCLSRAIVKSCLSLVFSCGMYDYSGTWASLVGLPAKSSVSGLIWVVIPGVAGLAIWSVRREMGGGVSCAVSVFVPSILPIN
jgi:glutaminase